MASNDLARIRQAIIQTWCSVPEVADTAIGFLTMPVLGMVIGKDSEKRMKSNKLWAAQLLHLINPWCIDAFFGKPALFHLPWVNAVTPAILCSGVLIACSYGVLVGPGLKQVSDDVVTIIQQSYAACFSHNKREPLLAATKAFCRLMAALLSVGVPLGNARDGNVALGLTAIVIVGTALANAPFVEKARQTIVDLVKKVLHLLMQCCGWTAKKCADLLEQWGGKPTEYELSDWVDTGEPVPEDHDDASGGEKETPEKGWSHVVEAEMLLCQSPGTPTTKRAEDPRTPLLQRGIRLRGDLVVGLPERGCCSVMSDSGKKKLAEHVGEAISTVGQITRETTAWGTYTTLHKGTWNQTCAWGAWARQLLGCPTRAWQHAEGQATAIKDALYTASAEKRVQKVAATK